MRFTTNTDHSAPRELPADLMSRCYAAARLNLRGMGYSTDDRLECAASIAARVVAEAAASDAATRRAPLGRRTGEPTRDAVLRMLRWIDRAERGDMNWMLTARSDAPMREVPFGKLSGMAANYRRGLDRQRQRDNDDANERARQDRFIPRVMDAPGELSGLTRDAAHAAARGALDALGLARLGRCYPLAYAAARGAQLALLTDAPLAQVERELGYAPGTLRKVLSRATARVPSAKVLPLSAHLDAVHALDAGGEAMKPTRSRNRSADLESDWRTRRASDNPSDYNARRAPGGRRSAGKTEKLTLDAGTARERTVSIPAHAPQWARELWRSNAATAQRLHRASVIRRERADAGELRQRETGDRIAGHDYTVR